MYEKIIVVTRQTRMQELVARFNTREQARFYLSHSGADFDDYEQEDDAYRRTLEESARQLDLGLNLQYVDRRFISNFLFSEKDIVVVIGQDGLVANVAKYAAGQPIIGVNPDPRRFDGVLVPVQAAFLRHALNAVISGKSKLLPVTLAEAKLHDGQRLLAFNDFFIGCQTHVSARYRLEYHKQAEDQSSSGIIVSTGAGSTGWLSSLFNMVSGINAMLGGQAISPIRLAWESSDLVFIVREPFESKHSQAGLVGGFLHEGESLELESRMPSGGTIFSDGIESDFLVFNSGSLASIRKAPEQALIYSAGTPERSR
jgi:NAD kinase